MISGKVHDWKTADDKFKTTICLDGIVRKDENGNILNDGTCPFCNRIDDGWSIYKYRKDLEEKTCALNGEEREKHMKEVSKEFGSERKAKESVAYMYILAVKFRTNNGQVVISQDDGLPEYDLKVMKWSNSRADKLQTALSNSGCDWFGAELIFSYPDVDNKMTIVSQSVMSPLYGDKTFISRYPKLEDKILADTNEFTWDGIESSFPEWRGMTTEEANLICKDLFEEWDKYKEELKVNPEAKYLEYVTGKTTTNPALNTSVAEEKQNVKQDIPTVAPINNMPTPPDINDLFGGAGLADKPIL